MTSLNTEEIVREKKIYIHSFSIKVMKQNQNTLRKYMCALDSQLLYILLFILLTQFQPCLSTTLGKSKAAFIKTIETIKSIIFQKIAIKSEER